MSSFNTQTYNIGPLSSLRMAETQEMEIFRDLIYTSDQMRLEEFSYLVDKVIPSLLKGVIVVSKTLARKVTNIYVQFPTYCINIKGENKEVRRLLTPLIAKQTDQSYMCTIYCDITSFNPINNEIISEEINKAIDSFPCMVGSSRCITSIKPEEYSSLDEWRLTLGEDPSIPGGHFIKNGAQKAVLYGEKLATNTYITIETKGTSPKVETRIMELHVSKTFLLRLHSGKRRATVKVLPPFLKGKHYPLFLVFYLLTIDLLKEKGAFFDPEKFIEQIISFAPIEEQLSIQTYLNVSRDKFNSKFVAYDEVEGGNYIKTPAIKKYIQMKSQNKATNKELLNFNESIEKLFIDTFPSKTTSCEKIANLCFMVCQQVRCAIGFRQFDSRDHWGLKKLDSPSVLIEREIAEFLPEKIRNGTTDDGQWRLGKKDKKENILESLKVDTTSLTRSLFEKVNAIVDEKSKSFSLRAVTKSGHFAICPAKTAEGSKCGISKSKCVCTKTSVNSEHIPGRLNALKVLSKLYETMSSTNFNEESEIEYSMDEGDNIEMVITEDKFTNKKLFFHYINEEGEDQGVMEVSLDEKQIYVSSFFTEVLLEDPKILELSETGEIDLYTEDDNIYIKLKIGEENFLQFWDGSIMEINCKDEVYPIFVRIFGIINEYFSIVKDHSYNFAFTYNGSVLNSGSDEFISEKILPLPMWVNPSLIVKEMKQKRREGILPIDCCIYKNVKDISIQYFDDSGRMLCPFLIVDDDGDLVLDKLNVEDDEGNIEKYKDVVWPGKKLLDYTTSGDRVESLYLNGVMELVDVKELDTIFIADTPNECRAFSVLRHFLNRLNIEDSDSYIVKTNNGLYQNKDIENVTIFGKEYNVYFTDEPEKYYDNDEDVEPLSIEIKYEDENGKSVESEMYGLIEYKINEYRLTDNRIEVFKKKPNAQIRDGFHLYYFVGDEYEWVPPGSVGMDDIEYNGNKIQVTRFFSDNEIRMVTKIEDGYYLANCNYKYFEKQENTMQFFSIETSNSDESESDEEVEENYVYYDEFLQGEIVCDIINFGDSNSGFFEPHVKIIYVPITEEHDVNIFDIDSESEKYDEIVKSNAINHRYSDLLMADIRRNIESIASIPEFVDYINGKDFTNINGIVKTIQELIPSFQNKSNIYKIFRYLGWRYKFTHVPIDPNLAYSSTANFGIKSNHNQGPRFTYQCAMNTQALGIGNIMYPTVFETSIKRLISPKQHMYETLIEEPLANVTMSTKENYVCAVNVHMRSPEDAFIISKSVYLLTARYEKKIKVEVREKNSGGVDQYITFPLSHDGNRNGDDIYRHLDEDGLPRIGSIIMQGDCIVGMMKNTDTPGKYTNASRMALIGDEGEVIQIRKFTNHVRKYTSENRKKEIIVSIVICQRRFQQIGDKMAATHSQKGTTGHITKENDTYGVTLSYPKYNEERDPVQNMLYTFMEDPEFRKKLDTGEIKYKIVDDDKMPLVIGGPNDGLAIQFLLNPFCFPSRMTMGLNYEMIISKAALEIQKKANATSFHKVNVEFYEQILIEAGLDKYGREFLAHADGEIMMDSTTGNQFKCFVGVVGYQVLKHHVYDKESVRQKGSRDAICKQPNRGRPFMGGQRFGEMERDTLLSHGASALLIERLKFASDAIDSIYCKTCGNRSNISDITIGLCTICGSSGSLIVNEQTKVFSVFCNYMSGLGLMVAFKY